MSGYTPISSAAQCGEYLNHIALNAILSEQSSKVLAGLVFSYVSVPFAIASTPLWIVADAAIGMVEAAIIRCKDGNTDKAFQNLYNKAVVSPIQQTVSAIVQLVCLVVVPYFAILAYPLSQGFVKNLPENVNPSQYNIFINGGLPSKNSPQLNKQIDDTIAYCKKHPPAPVNKEYDAFRSTILSRPSAKAILGISPQDLSDQLVNQKIRKLSLVVHSDKHPDRTEEASLLFKCLQEAGKQLNARKA